MVPDIRVVESSPQLKHHSPTATNGPHDLSLNQAIGRERERVAGVMREGWVGNTEGQVSLHWL